MIVPADFLRALADNGVSFAAGVPDSLLKDICAAITDSFPAERHVIAANEGAAVGLAIGHHLATGRPALVYMQNSGLGNAVNPLASLAAPEIYGVPMVLMIGWRGEIAADGRQLKDEPQHVLQGQVTLPQLELLGIAHRVVDAASDPAEAVRWAASEALATSRPVALVVRKGAFAGYALPARRQASPHTREAAIAAVAGALPADAAVVATTGMASRELFELRKRDGAGHDSDFLTVGGMGHAASIAAGLALAQPERPVVCLDGDGAILMHLGALTESALRPNLLHVVLNNEAHDSVGGQPTAAGRLDLLTLAQACGYRHIARAEPAEAGAAIADLLAADGAGFLEIRCGRGARPDLGRPDRTPAENKRDVMAFLQETAR
ncbi:phosphonopyruvate decarboxylase [Phenylobacterium sp. LjRoot219]|uniref:phosphonopyruvate decarboxylase n=1 Tax=Phenylobacterium sp. LjRoot219 TaxID=3342283 RepID=UPI003ECFD792